MSRLTHTLLLVFFAVTTYGAWWNVRGQMAAQHWRPTLCLIERSETERESHSSGDHFIFRVRYRYDFAGRSFTADRYSFSTSGGRFSAPEEADALMRQWAAGSETTCWIDPHNPAEAVLDRVEGWEFGLVCLIIGALPLVLGSLQHSPPVPGENGHDWPSIAWKEFWFSVLLAALLVPAFLGLSLAPVWQAVQARGWSETPCEIVSSRIVCRGREFRPEIVFAWRHGGQIFRSGQARFSEWHEGLPTVEALVAKYPAGAQKVCRINPRDPSSAVLDPTYHFDAPVEIFGLTFVVLALLWVWRAACRLRRGPEAAAGLGESRYDMELLFPGISTGTWGWLAISLLNVAGLAPIVWREWQAGLFPTIYGVLFVGAVISVLAALSVALLRHRRLMRNRLRRAV